MYCGGGVGGFIATRDEERYAREYPTLQVSLFDTIEPGERGFGLTLFEQTSYGSREHGKDWTGNSVYLWTVVNAAYMALLGPAGLRRARRADPAAQPLRGEAARRAPGVARQLPRGFFKEFVVDFDGTGKTVAEINARCASAASSAAATSRRAFPQLGQSALYCVTEVHTPGRHRPPRRRARRGDVA